MRFRSLQIPAFGPFTRYECAFPSERPDLHLIYGPNEAGKSSLLRAIRGLLFGIPTQSADNFLHDYKDFRIGAEIETRDGKVLRFQRRKGSKNTLLDGEGKLLGDAALTPFLGGVGADYFAAMFGLGSKELHEGAEQLLRGEGEMGAALFSASSGGTPVRKVVEALKTEAEKIFKGRATSNVTLRPALNEYRDLLRQSRETVVTAEQWERIEKELEQAQEDRRRTERELADYRSQRAWVERCEDALPTVGQLVESTRSAAGFEGLPEFGGAFVDRVREVMASQERSGAEAERLSGQAQRMRAQLEACVSSAKILEEAAVLDEIHQELGVYRERGGSVTKAKARLGELGLRIEVAMRRLGLGGDFATLDRLRLTTAVELRFEEAAGTLRTCLSELHANLERGEKLRRELATREMTLQELPAANLERLREGLAVAAGAIEADRSLALLEAEVAQFGRTTADRHRLVIGAPADLELTAAMTVPALATIRRYHEGLEALRREMETVRTRLNETRNREQAIHAEVRRLQIRGELPSEETLKKARELRDYGWRLVVREWKGGSAGEQLTVGVPLEEAFPRAVEHADAVADALRLNAGAVAQAQEKAIQLEELTREIEMLNGSLATHETRLAERQTSWVEAWNASGISPRSPMEMEEWRSRWSEFRESLSQLRSAEDRWRARREQVERAKQVLTAALGRSGEKEFGLLFAEAKQSVQQAEQAEGRRLEMSRHSQTLRSENDALEQSLASLEERVRQATSEWHALCAVVGFDASTTPEAGLKLLQERRLLLRDFDEWLVEEQRVGSLVEQRDDYERRVRMQAQRMSMGVESDPVETLEGRLWSALAEARTLEQRRQQLVDQLAQVESDWAQAREDQARVLARVQELVQTAGVISAGELEPLVVNLRSRQTIREHMAGLRRTLSGLARGGSVDEFLERVGAEDADGLSARKTVLDQAIQAREAELTRLSAILLNLSAEKAKLEQAGDVSADLRQRAETRASGIQREASRYVRLRLAIRLLEDQIARFREKNQGPLLVRSGEIFKAITGGAFEGLGAEMDAHDLPVLAAIRRDGKRVMVGGLSDGSRDQLFLALRLAALELHMEEHEPMPLILDDLLITFDDNRARAILPILAQASRRTQVLLFTHHEHLIELGLEVLGAETLHVHRL